MFYAIPYIDRRWNNGGFISEIGHAASVEREYRRSGMVANCKLLPFSGVFCHSYLFFGYLSAEYATGLRNSFKYERVQRTNFTVTPTCR